MQVDTSEPYFPLSESLVRVRTWKLPTRNTIGMELGPFWVRVQFLTMLLAPWGHHRFAIVGRRELTGVAAGLRIVHVILTIKLRGEVDSESSRVTRALVRTEKRAQLDSGALPFTF